jgi:hypothetical protein
MNAIDVVIAIRAAGGIITIEDGVAVVDAPADLPDSVWEAAVAHRDEIVRLVAGDEDASLDAHPFVATVSRRLPGAVSIIAAKDDPFPSAVIPQPPGVDSCDRCRATETVASTIHGGASAREDCARCGRFRRFSIWNGKATT